MSTLTQFTGTTPIGGTTTFSTSTYGTNPTLNGAEYLAAGYTKPYSATYATFYNTVPSGTTQIPTTNANSDNTWTLTANVTSAQNNGAKLEYSSVGTNYWYFWMGTQNASFPGNAYAYGSSISSTSTSIVNGSYVGYDSITFAGYALFSFLSSPTYLAYRCSTTATTAFSVTTPIGWAASPSLCVGVQMGTAITNSSGFVTSSTNGTTWTAQTPSILMSGTRIYRVAYSTVGGVFIYVSNDGTIYTSTDGFTLTQRSSPSGMPTAFGLITVFGNQFFTANSPSATIISIGGGNAGGGPYLLRTTNGTTFTLIDLSNTGNGAFALQNSSGTRATPIVTYDTTTSKFVMTNAMGTTTLTNNPAPFYATSTDGITWTLDSFKVSSAFSYAIPAGIGMANNNFYVSIGNNNGTNAFVTPCFFNSKIGAAPDLVGNPSSPSQGSIAYARIA